MEIEPGVVCNVMLERVGNSGFLQLLHLVQHLRLVTDIQGYVPFYVPFFFALSFATSKTVALHPHPIPTFDKTSFVPWFLFVQNGSACLAPSPCVVTCPPFFVFSFYGTVAHAPPRPIPIPMSPDIL